MIVPFQLELTVKGEVSIPDAVATNAEQTEALVVDEMAAISRKIQAVVPHVGLEGKLRAVVPGVGVPMHKAWWRKIFSHE